MFSEGNHMSVLEKGSSNADVCTVATRKSPPLQQLQSQNSVQSLRKLPPMKRQATSRTNRVTDSNYDQDLAAAVHHLDAGLGVYDYVASYASVATVSALTFGFATSMYHDMTNQENAVSVIVAVLVSLVIALELFSTCVCTLVCYQLSRLAGMNKSESAIHAYLAQTKSIRVTASRAGWTGLQLYVVAAAVSKFGVFESAHAIVNAVILGFGIVITVFYQIDLRRAYMSSKVDLD